MTTIAARFWRKVKKGAPDECWPWTAARNHRGYGKFNNTNAHRVAWGLACGAIPAGLFVLHTCDNPPCCNPSHLFLGTHADNMRDMIAKGRSRGPTGERHGSRTHPECVPRGDGHSHARLTEVAVREILALVGTTTQAAIATRFGVSQMTISDVVRRATWRHVS